MIDRRREEFPALADGIHLLSHSLGPVPRAARAALGACLDRWERQVREDPWSASWWDLPREAGDRIAALLGAAPGTVQVQPNTSVALSVVISCLDLERGPRRKVVTTALDFPTTAYIWEAQRRLGVEVAVVPSDDGLTTPLDRVLEAIDEDTGLVALSHVSYRSSHRLDPRPIVARAREVGSLVLLDVYQSAGVMELDAAGWGVDFLIGGTIKWLCGGPACGYLYVRPGLSGELEPRLTGWFAHREPFEFSPAPIRHPDSARRFAQGTPPIAAIAACLPGLDIVQQVGVDAIAAESRRRTSWIIDEALSRGWRVNSPHEAASRGGAVMIGVADPAGTTARLRERKVLVDWRPGVGLRLGPHFFNTDEEIHAALELLAGLLG